LSISSSFFSFWWVRPIHSKSARTAAASIPLRPRAQLRSLSFLFGGGGPYTARYLRALGSRYFRSCWTQRRLCSSSNTFGRSERANRSARNALVRAAVLRVCNKVRRFCSL
jgi:hypothetical protein